MKKLLQALVSQDGALSNARSAATALSGQRVERQEVELFLERLEDRAQRQPDVTAVGAVGKVAPR